jgi:iron complex transport system ATP-binding protein
MAKTPVPDDESLIEIRNASIYRGDTRVFDRFNLTIPQHEPVAILGPNGSGKTTLLKVINREICPVRDPRSSVRILGRERWNVWDLRSHIGMVSHDLQAHYTPGATGLDVVLSGFLSSIGIHGLLADRITAKHRDRALLVLEELGAADLAVKRLENMSTGQQRRCLLARALVHAPDTLILDEPTAGLDLSAAFDYLDRIRRLSENGTNIVLVSHSLNEIPPAIDRVILLRGGRIVADGPKDRVLTERNLEQTYGVRMKVAMIDGYYLAYPATAAGSA